MRAELLMIIDLERNDLGRICKTGSVKVDPLFKVESYSYVHHLVGVVQGILKKEIGFAEIFRALFPGGSITGAPKFRAMQIINELENYPRSIYTGALGFIGYGSYSSFNLPIRTMIKKDDSIFHPSGGGIVIDSNPDDEYQEMLDKVSVLLEFV
jgi:para-aminobenzoate synthetase component 1